MAANARRPVGVPPVAARFRSAAAFLAAVVLLATVLSAEPIPPDLGLLAGTDDLGRPLPTAAECGPPKANRAVGLFYWQWHTGLRAGPDYDVGRFLASHPKFDDFKATPAGGPKNPTWYWGEPAFGYYRSDDPWVARKQLPLFAAAGVDFLFLDYTNGSVYDRELTTLVAAADDLKAKGSVTPRLTFFLNYQPEWKVESLYTRWYKPGKHDDDWFRWDGKPLLMSPVPTDATKLKDPKLLPEIQRYFTFRPTWALERADRDKHLWRFLSEPTDPPALGPDGAAEQMVVGKSMGGPIWHALEDGGVSATGPKGKHTRADYDGGWLLPDAARGVFFQAEWDHAMAVGPPVLLVTGWNEWTASVWETPGVPMLGAATKKGQGFLVDEFNPQFNRDLEPVRGGYGDDYYWQFASNLRRYRGVAAPPPASPRVTSAVDAPAAAWADVRPVYHDTVGEVARRDWDGNVKGLHYTDDSARNDIATAQVARDAETVTFRATTAAPLTPPAGQNWMTLLVDADADAKTGWHGYDLLIDRARGDGTASVERYDGTAGRWRWRKVADVPVHWAGDALAIAVPRRLLEPEARPLRFDFKWADNLPAEPTETDFYTAGDVAPDGRFSWRYEGG